MTELLQLAIAEIEKLPAEEQNAIATSILVELKDEQSWKICFQATTDNQWNSLAEMVEVFPSQLCSQAS